MKDSDAIDDEQIFVRELVHILTKYNLSSFTISKLQNDIKALRNKNTTLENSIDDLNNKIYQLTRTGGVKHVTLLVSTPLPQNTSMIEEVISIDGNGTECTIKISNGEIEIVTQGKGYKVHDILSFTLQNNTYIVKVQNIDIQNYFINQIALNPIKVVLPIWTQLYLLMDQTRGITIRQIKDDVLKYDIQYAILKYVI